MDLKQGTETVRIEICTDPREFAHVAKLFATTVDNTYVSHSELKYGFASPDGTWGTGVEQSMHERLTILLRDEPLGNGSEYVLVVARFDRSIIGFALLEYETRDGFPATLIVHDIVVGKAARGLGLGKALLLWVQDHARGKGVSAMFLESGINNPDAHSFFEGHGFRKTAVMMMKPL